MAMRLRAMTQALNGQPAMIEPRRLTALLEHEDVALPEAGPLEARSEGVVAVVPVHGTLMDHPGWIDEIFGFVGYQDVVAAVAQAVADPEVSAVILDIDSPGGTAGGAFAAADAISRLRGSKPIVALANSWATSAAYLLAAACDQTFVTPGGTVGSIGVIMAVVDYSRRMADAGITVTMIHQGARKADGNPHQPLTEDGRAELQSQVDQLYGIFVEAVSSYRKIDARVVRAQESRIYIGQMAIDAGLADGFASMGELVAELAAGAGQESSMTTKLTGAPGAPSQTKASIEDNLEAVSAAFPQASAALRAAGATDELARVTAILDLAKKPSTLAAARDAILAGKSKEGFLEERFLAAEGATDRARDALATDIAAVKAHASPSPDDQPEAPLVQVEKNDDAEAIEAKCKAVWDKDPEIRARFHGSFPAFRGWTTFQSRGGTVHVHGGGTVGGNH